MKKKANRRRQVARTPKQLGGNEIPFKDDPFSEKVDELWEPSEFLALRAAAAKRWRMLARDETFVLETASLKWQLGQFFRDSPKEIRNFFKPTFPVSWRDYRAVKKRIDGISNAKLKKLLARYVRYSLLYNVKVVLNKKQPWFRVRDAGSLGDNFHVVLRNGRVEPKRSISARELEESNSSLDDEFVSEKPGDMPPGLAPLIEGGLAKYVLIKDKEKFSVLRQILQFAYSPTQVTVLQYDSFPRQRIYLVGDTVPLSQVWNKLRKVAADSQRRPGNRDRRGRLSNLSRLYGQVNALLRNNGKNQKELAIDLLKLRGNDAPTEGEIATTESRLSQVKRRLELIPSN
jgi:hypothetical protein